MGRLDRFGHYDSQLELLWQVSRLLDTFGPIFLAAGFLAAGFLAAGFLTAAFFFSYEQPASSSEMTSNKLISMTWRQYAMQEFSKN